LRGIMLWDIGSPLGPVDAGSNAANHGFAALFGFALAWGDTWFPNDSPPQLEYWQQVANELATKTGHPELGTLPVFIMADSRRSAFVHQYLQAHADQLIGFHVWSGFVPDDKTVSNPAAVAVPGLFIPAERDGAAVADTVDGLVPWRAKGARWGVAPAWGAKHGTTAGMPLAMPYWDQVIRARVPAGATGPKVELNELPEASGVLADTSAWSTVSPYAEYKGDKTKAAWLPNAYVGNVWAGYVLKSASVRITAPAGDFDRKPSGAGAGKPYDVAVDGAPAGARIFDGDRALGPAPRVAGVTFPAGVRGLVVLDAKGAALSKAIGFTVDGDYWGR
jgi:hypothetical protein